MRHTTSSKPYSFFFMLLKIFPRVKNNSSLWSTSHGIKTFSHSALKTPEWTSRLDSFSWHFCANVADASPDTHLCETHTCCVQHDLCLLVSGSAVLTKMASANRRVWTVPTSYACDVSTQPTHSLRTRQCCGAEVTNNENVLLLYYSFRALSVTNAQHTTSKMHDVVT